MSVSKKKNRKKRKKITIVKKKDKKEKKNMKNINMCKLIDLNEMHKREKCPRTLNLSTGTHCKNVRACSILTSLESINQIYNLWC